MRQMHTPRAVQQLSGPYIFEINKPIRINQLWLSLFAMIFLSYQGFSVSEQDLSSHEAQDPGSSTEFPNNTSHSNKSSSPQNMEIIDLIVGGEPYGS